MTPPRALVLLGMVLGSLAVAGCGMKDASTTASTMASTTASTMASITASPSAARPAVMPPTPSADDFVTSVMRTRGLATAAIEVSVVTVVAGDGRTLEGTGVSATNRGVGDLLWTDATGATTRELSNGQGLFVQTDVPDGTWTRLTGPRSTPTGALTDPLRSLGGLADVSREGSDDLDGTPTTRYTGTLPASPENLALLGFSDEELVAIGTDGQDGIVQVTAWIDGSGRVVGIRRSVDLPGAAAGPVSAETMTRLRDFASSIDLAPPPSESVAEAPEGQ